MRNQKEDLKGVGVRLCVKGSEGQKGYKRPQ